MGRKEKFLLNFAEVIFENKNVGEDVIPRYFIGNSQRVFFFYLGESKAGDDEIYHVGVIFLSKR